MASLYLICATGAGETMSPEERALAVTISELLGGRGLVFDAVVTSPVGSAMEMAQLVARATGFAGEPEAVRALSPGVPVDVALRGIVGRGGSLAVVANATLLASLCGRLIGQASYGAFRPGFVLAVEGREPAWRLEPGKSAFIPLMLERK